MNQAIIKVFITVSIFVGSVATGVICQVNQHWRDEAVKHQAAHYYLDANNQRQWEWDK